MFTLCGESKKIQKKRDGHQYYICCSNARFWSSFQEGQRHVRRVPYVPRLSFKPFHVAISEGWHVAVGISSKATDRADICYKYVFFLSHNPCFPLRVLCFPPDPVFSTRSLVFHQTACYPQSSFSTPRVFQTPRTPYPVP